MQQAFSGFWVLGAASGPQPSHPILPSDGQVQLSLAVSWLCPSLEQNQRPPPQTSLLHLHPSTLVRAPPGPSRAVCHLLSLCLLWPHPLVSRDSPTACPLLLPPVLLPHFHNPELRAHSGSGPRHSLTLPGSGPATSRAFLAPTWILGLRLPPSVHTAPHPTPCSLNPLPQPFSEAHPGPCAALPTHPGRNRML